jgi:hypothetical protein
MSNKLITEAATYTDTQYTQGVTSMPSAGFKLAIPAIEWPETYALDHGSTGIGEFSCILFVIAIAGELVLLGM